MPQLLIATPVRDGVVTTKYMNSIVSLLSALRSRSGSTVRHFFLESTLVARARNAYVTAFLADPSFTHLLFVDSDMGFSPSAVLRLLDFGKPYAGCICPYRAMDYARFHAIARQIEDPALARSVAQNYVTGDRLVGGGIDQGFAQTERLGMALTLLTREAVQTMADALPDLWGAPDAGYAAMGIKGRVFQPFSEYRVDEGMILSEDMSFARRWSELGGEIWACLDETITHTGPAVFSGRFMDRLRFEQDSRGPE